MTIIISLISQKGGVGKSTLSQAIAVEATKNYKTLLVDCDVQQTTSKLWGERRFLNNLSPKIQTLVTDNFTLLSQECEKYDIVIIDGPAHTSKLTVEIAKFSNLVIQPSGATIADLYTSVLEFNTLLQEGIDKNKLLIVLNQIHSEMQEKKAREYLQQTNYQVLNGSLPSKVAYCTAQDEGKAITEVNYPTLKFRAQDIIREIITFLQNHA